MQVEPFLFRFLAGLVYCGRCSTAIYNRRLSTGEKRISETGRGILSKGVPTFQQHPTHLFMGIPGASSSFDRGPSGFYF